jgi:hypothetical protein
MPSTSKTTEIVGPAGRSIMSALLVMLVSISMPVALFGCGGKSSGSGDGGTNSSTSGTCAGDAIVNGFLNSTNGISACAPAIDWYMFFDTNNVFGSDSDAHPCFGDEVASGTKVATVGKWSKDGGTAGFLLIANTAGLSAYVDKKAVQQQPRMQLLLTALLPPSHGAALLLGMATFLGARNFTKSAFTCM